MVKQFAISINIEDIVCLVGIMILASWLLRTSLGRKSLAETEPRRNNMPIYLPFVALFIWLGAVSMLDSGFSMLVEYRVLGIKYRDAFFDNFILCIGALATIAVIIFLARVSFARRLRGFGLDIKTIHRDLLAAPLNLLSVWPILLVTIILTTRIGRLIWGQEYQIPQHEELKIISAHPQLPIRILIIITAVLVAPVLEEMLFRGLFQTMIRSNLDDRYRQLDTRQASRIENRAGRAAWGSILISSMIFTTVHYNVAHWPALFVLALCLGYAYEKSGSLFRPIFIHALFNGVTIAAALNG